MPVFLFGCLFSLVWSSAFVAGKVSIDYVLPLNFLFFRFVSAGLLLLAVWAWLNRRQPFAGLRNRRLWLVGSLLGCSTMHFTSAFPTPACKPCRRSW